jgi:hypothetical protein
VCVCGCVDPSEPCIVSTTHTSVQLTWAPVTVLGDSLGLGCASDTCIYSVEMAEGHKWKPGIASKFVASIRKGYKPLCMGPRLVRAVVEDLKPATWYSTRIVIICRGRRAQGKPVRFATGEVAFDGLLT